MDTHRKQAKSLVLLQQKKKEKEISEKNISSQTSLRQPMDSGKTKKIHFCYQNFC